MYPESIRNLIEAFKCFPGIGEKTAERMAFSILDFDDLKASETKRSIAVINFSESVNKSV